MNYRLIFTTLVAVLFLAAGPAWAAQPLGLNSFTKNTPAIADSVNENFTALEKAVPVMWASIDKDPQSISPGAVAVTTNSLNISTPDPGILLINGSVFINHRNPRQCFYQPQKPNITLILLPATVCRRYHSRRAQFPLIFRCRTGYVIRY